jgi:hypothetical protein
MAIRLVHTVDYDLPIDAFFQALTDSDAVKWRTVEQGRRLLDLNRIELADSGIGLEVAMSNSFPALRKYGITVQRSEKWTWTPTRGIRQLSRVFIPFAPGTVKLRGEFEPTGPEQTSGKIQVDITANVPFVGRRLEQVFADAYRTAAEREQFLISGWLCEQGLVVTPPGGPGALVGLGTWTGDGLVAI